MKYLTTQILLDRSLTSFIILETSYKFESSTNYNYLMPELFDRYTRNQRNVERSDVFDIKCLMLEKKWWSRESRAELGNAAILSLLKVFIRKSAPHFGKYDPFCKEYLIIVWNIKSKHRLLLNSFDLDHEIITGFVPITSFCKTLFLNLFHFWIYFINLN